MRLTNPTEDELNAAVTKYIVKSVPCDQWKPFMHDSMIQGDCGHANCHPTQMQINYCKYADAILPWLEKWGAEHGRAITIGLYCDGTGHTVEIAGGPSETGWSIPRIAVVVLLRANGVEIEFT